MAMETAWHLPGFLPKLGKHSLGGEVTKHSWEVRTRHLLQLLHFLEAFFQILGKKWCFFHHFHDFQFIYSKTSFFLEKSWVLISSKNHAQYQTPCWVEIIAHGGLQTVTHI